MASKTLTSILDQITDQLHKETEDVIVKAFGRTFEVLFVGECGHAMLCIAGMDLPLRTLKSLLKLNHQLTQYVF